MTSLLVHPATQPLFGSIRVPADEAIAIRAAFIAALCRGRSRIVEWKRTAAGAAALACLRSMAVAVDEPSPSEVVIHGGGLEGPRDPDRDLRAGRTGGAIDLLCGVVGGRALRAVIVDDDVPKARMAQTIEALAARGVLITGVEDPRQPGEAFAPLSFAPRPPRDRLRRLEWVSRGPDPRIKGALLMSGLFAEGVTRFREPLVSCDHTERLLANAGAPLRAIGPIVEIDPASWDGRMQAIDIAVPGDLSAAALIVAAAQTVPGSRVTLRGVGVNPTRAGWLEVGRDMGAGLTVVPRGEHDGEPVAEIHAWTAALRGTTIGGETMARAAADLPAACVLAARAAGTTRICDAAQAFDDRQIHLVAHALRAFGVECQLAADGIEVVGRQDRLDPSDIRSGGDPYVAMMAAALALAGAGPTRVRDVDRVAVAFPRFVGFLRALGARVDVEAG